MDSLSERLNKALNLLFNRGRVRNYSDVARKLGVKPQIVSDARHNRCRRLNESFLELVANTFPDDLNKEYMLTGEGAVEKIDSLGGTPHFNNIEVAAGYMNDQDEYLNDSDLRPTPVGIPDCDFSISVYGDSMYPQIQDGDIIYCKEHTDRFNLPIDSVCVIDSSEGAVVKQLVEATDDYFVLHSFNPNYEDKKISLSEVRHLFTVVGLIRSF